MHFSDDCENLEEFPEAEGFLVDVDNESYMVPVIDLVYSVTMDRMQENHKIKGRMTILSQLADTDAFYSYIQKKGISLLETEQASSGYSLIRMNKKGKINGCMLISRQSDGNLVIPCLISDTVKDGVIDFFLAFKALVQKKEWLGRNIVFSDSTGEMIGFLEKVLGEERSVYVINGLKQGVRTV